MLLLFVINELSYDKHFKNADRIISLNSVFDENGFGFSPLNLRQAYTEIPGKIPGVEAAVQIFTGWDAGGIVYESKHFDINLLYTDKEFFDVFRMKFIEGTPQSAFAHTNSIVITDRNADKIFGGAGNAIGKTVLIGKIDYTVSGVVKELPVNTHFSFDVLANMQSVSYLSSINLDFYTYYLIKADIPMDEVRASIEKEYTSIVKPFGAQFNSEVYGATEKFTDIYLNSKADFTLGKKNNMNFIRILSGLALLILLLAVANFINLFMAQGEARMDEIGIRKASGAEVGDIVWQFFKEVSIIVLAAFVAGFILVIIFAPFFSKLIDKNIDLIQLLNPSFILPTLVLFVITVCLSAFYPAFYLSRFSPLDILGKRLTFSKRRLNIIVVTFQSVITIMLIFGILLLNKQTNYLKNVPVRYNPNNVMLVSLSQDLGRSYDALRQALQSLPEVKMVAGANHAVGYGPAGQVIGLLQNKDKNSSINEYRITPGLSELLEFELKEGSFFKEGVSDSVNQIILNEAAVAMLELQAPVIGYSVNYKGPAEIIGVVKDFCYGNPAETIQPLVLSNVKGIPGLIYLKFGDTADKILTQDKIRKVIKEFDPVYNFFGMWADDIYKQKFDNINMQSKIILAASLLSLFISMMGLVAIHLYTTERRTREIGIRRVNGASTKDLFILLSSDIIKWIFIAGVIALPFAYYNSIEWLADYEKRTSVNWTLFVLPLVIQCIVALLVTSGISYKALLQNPVKALKKE